MVIYNEGKQIIIQKYDTQYTFEECIERLNFWLDELKTLTKFCYKEEKGYLKVIKKNIDDFYTLFEKKLNEKKLISGN